MRECNEVIDRHVTFRTVAVFSFMLFICPYRFYMFSDKINRDNHNDTMWHFWASKTNI